MTPAELELVVSRACLRLLPPSTPPLPEAWLLPETHYGTELPSELKAVHDLSARYDIPGDWLTIEELVTVPAIERRFGRDWPVTLIPFFALGNGDYFCLDSRAGPTSPVFILAHDSAKLQTVAKTLEIFLRDRSFFP